ncbi:hypothetical protein ACFFV7_02410 [Nonomuraea spiralis]|uniref:Uncharacterized protein n=1 Tax=Nonomuraea spiralis TaxID=46182 RepID=A0ABV5I6S6_9ACTN|nr:hypothetical protein [Nonomuraea spiralis]GGS65401.1 hypothetical protein GCM10010176_004830 [Nonomuraea spiralis]
MRIVVLVMLVAPGLSMLLLLAGRLELAGMLTGLAAGFLLRSEPARAALATLCGSLSAVLIGQVLGDGVDGPDFADQMAGWPGWPIGAVLAYLIAAKGLPPTSARGTSSAVLPAAVAALTAGALGCGQLVAAKVLQMTRWEDYHEYDGPGWYRDLTSAILYPAASVVIASVIASRMTAGRERFLVVPLAAWLGCALTAGPVQYVQALGVSGEPALVALLASLAGGGIGAAAAAAALRHGGARLGLVSFILAFTVGKVTAAWLEISDVTWAWLELLFALLALITPLVLIAWVSARTASRDASLGSGVIAGVAGPLLIWSVYLTVGPRFYDHASQSNPYWLAWATVPVALVTALGAASLVTSVHGTRESVRPDAVES